MEVSKNRGILPNHPLIDGFSIISNPFWGTQPLGNPFFLHPTQKMKESRHNTRFARGHDRLRHGA